MKDEMESKAREVEEWSEEDLDDDNSIQFSNTECSNFEDFIPLLQCRRPILKPKWYLNEVYKTTLTTTTYQRCNGIFESDEGNINGTEFVTVGAAFEGGFDHTINHNQVQ